MSNQLGEINYHTNKKLFKFTIDRLIVHFKLEFNRMDTSIVQIVVILTVLPVQFFG